MSGVPVSSVSRNPLSFLSATTPKIITTHSSPSFALFPFSKIPSNLKLNGSPSPRFHIRCTGPGESDSRTVLDAFFLGKALAEAVTERIESTIGEVLSGIGRLQAEQQKQILDFQDEVIERAKKAKEKAARDAIEVQGPISPSIISPTYAFTSSPTTKHEVEVDTTANPQPSKPDTDEEPTSGEE